jgi:hypothetical protein
MIRIDNYPIILVSDVYIDEEDGFVYKPFLFLGLFRCLFLVVHLLRV